MPSDKINSSGGRNQFAFSFMPGKMETVLYLLVSILLCVVCLGVFYQFPNLDMSVTASVFSDDRFPLRSDATVKFIRRAIIWAIILFYALVLWSGLKSFHEQKPVFRFDWTKWAYLGAAALIGSVMLINVTLKGNWGRARPQDVVEFGGAWDFTPFWVIGQQCLDNCSFASGEVSGIAMVFFSLAFLVNKPKRLLLLFTGLLVSSYAAWTRIVMGSHFLSDTIMATVLMLLVAPIVYYFFFLRDAKWIDALNRKRLAAIEKSD